MPVVFSPLPLSSVQGLSSSSDLLPLTNSVRLTALPAFLLTSAHLFPGDDRHLPTVVADGKLDEHALGKPGEIPG